MATLAQQFAEVAAAMVLSEWCDVGRWPLLVRAIGVRMTDADQLYYRSGQMEEAKIVRVDAIYAAAVNAASISLALERDNLDNALLFTIPRNYHREIIKLLGGNKEPNFNVVLNRDDLPQVRFRGMHLTSDKDYDSDATHVDIGACYNFRFSHEARQQMSDMAAKIRDTALVRKPSLLNDSKIMLLMYGLVYDCMYAKLRDIRNPLLNMCHLMCSYTHRSEIVDIASGDSDIARILQTLRPSEQAILTHSLTGARHDPSALTLRLRLRYAPAETHPHLRNPHVLVFVTHDCTAVQAADARRSRLEHMWKRTRGHLLQLDVQRSTPFELQLAREPPAGAYLYMVVFYEKTSSREDDPPRISPQYELESHARVPLQQLQERGRATVGAYSGPRGRSLTFDPDTFKVTHNFETALDCRLTVTLGDEEAAERGDEVSEQVDSPSPLDPDNEPKRVQFLAEMSKQSAGERLAQTYAYQGFPGGVYDVLAATWLRPSEDEPAQFSYGVARALQRCGLGAGALLQLCDYCERGRADMLSEALLVTVINRALNTASELVYREDTLNGNHVDQMQDIRLVGEGDCEDSAQCTYAQIERFLSLSPSELSAPAARLQQYLKTHYVPAYTVLQARAGGESTMHCIATLLPVSKLQESAGGGGGGAGRDRPLIVLEGTNATEAVFRSIEDIDRALAEQARKAVATMTNAALGAWHEFKGALKTGDAALGGDTSPYADANNWVASRPLSAEGEVRDSFYEKFISACVRLPGRDTRAFVRFVHTSGTDGEYGVPFTEAVVHGRYRMQFVDNTPKYSEANRSARDYTLPLPLAHWTAEKGGEPSAWEPERTAAEDAVRAVQQAVAAAAPAKGWGKPPAPAEGYDNSQYVPYTTLTLYYNVSAAPAQGGYTPAVNTLQTMLKSESVRKADCITAEGVWLLPGVYVIAVTLYFNSPVAGS